MVKVGQNSILPCTFKRAIEICPCFLNSLKSEERSRIAFMTSEETVCLDGSALAAEEVEGVFSLLPNKSMLALPSSFSLAEGSGVGATTGERASTDSESSLSSLRLAASAWSYS